MSLINKLPIVKKIKQKLYKRLEVLENESLISAAENINLRIKLKLMNHEKIKKLQYIFGGKENGS